MIATIRGCLTTKETNWIIIDVAGVGFHVLIPLSTYYKLPQVGETILLQTSMIVREDHIALYGFLSTEEKRLFHLLLSVSKVGPRMALNLLSGIETHDLITAILTENVLAIKSIPGIGLKTAERIILELKGKIGQEAGPVSSGLPALDQNQKVQIDDALAALVALGYRQNEAQTALKKAIHTGTAASMEALVKQSLNLLSKRDKS
ncbi:Holliday junction branch migration protein RuvA [bacterium]|nr:Holliday junction branch migration protein RuvA [bacterium]